MNGSETYYARLLLEWHLKLLKYSVEDKYARYRRMAKEREASD